MAIDWSAIGPGAIGEEIATLVAFSPLFLEVPALDALVFAGYLAGLNDVGWRRDEAVVRLGCTTATAVALALCCCGYTLPHVEKHEVRVKWEQLFGRPQAALQAQWRESHKLGLALADEALTLLNRVAER